MAKTRTLLIPLLLTLLVGRPVHAQPAPQPAPEPAPEPAPPRFDLGTSLAEGSLRLGADEAAARAVQTAPSLARARASVAVAEQGARDAWVPLLPRLDVSARYLRIGGFDDGTVEIASGDVPVDQLLAVAETVEDPAARTLLSGMIQQQAAPRSVTFAVPRDQIGFRASLTVPLSDLFLTLLPAYRAAEAQATLEQRRLEATRADVATSAREAYYRYAQARASRAVAISAVRLAEEHRGLIESMVRAGLSADSQLLQAEARLAAARSAVARADGGVAIARVALTSLLHLPSGTEIAITERIDTQIPAPPEVSDALLSRAYRSRPEVRALEELLVVQGHAARAASGAHWPHLALVAGADYANPNPRVIPASEQFDPSWEVGAVLTWSPSDTLRASARTAQTRAMMDQARADLATLQDGVRLQVVQAREELVAARAVMRAAVERVTAAERSYDARLAEVRAGEAVILELLDADLEVTRARLDIIGAGVDMRVADARFRRATGAAR